jgi:hypothetical protein
LRKIFGPVKGNGIQKIRTNQELIDLYTEPLIISEIRTGRLQWLGHVERMPEKGTVRKVFKKLQIQKGPLESQERDGWMMLKMV